MAGSNNGTAAAAGPVTTAELMAATRDILRGEGSGRDRIREADACGRLLHESGLRSVFDLPAVLPRYAALAASRGPAGGYALVKTLKKLWKLWHDRGWCPPVPDDFPPNPRPASAPAAVPSRGRIRDFLDRCRAGSATFEGLRGFALSATIFYAGVETRPACDLLVADVDLDARTMIVAGQVVIVPMQLAPILAPWVAWLRRLGCRHLFPANNRAEPWTAAGETRSSERTGPGPRSWIRATARAGGFVEITPTSLHRAHAAHVRLEPVFPGVDVGGPLEPADDAPAVAAGAKAPLRTPDVDEVTRIMARLEGDSAAWEGVDLLACAALALFEGVDPSEIPDAGEWDARLDGPRPTLYLPARESAIPLRPETADILRRRAAHPDRARAGSRSPNASIVRAARFRRMARRLGIGGRVTLRSLARFHAGHNGRFELGEAWRRAPAAAPSPGRPAGAGDGTETGGTRSKLATWDPPIPAVEPMGEEGGLYVLSVFGERVTIRSRVLFEAIVALEGAFPAGLSKAALDHRCRGWRTALYREETRIPALREGLVFPEDDGGSGDYRILDMRRARHS